MFEMECNRGVTNFNDTVEEVHVRDDNNTTPSPGTKNLLLKGQMKYIPDINAIIYLCSPV